MITIEPVIETSGACGFGAWPAGATSGDGFLVLSGDLTLAEVGTVMAVITAFNRSSIIPDGEEGAHPGPAILIQRIIDAEALLAPGGLRVRDPATGLTVNPGCCCGLEDWQEWNHLAPGKPTPWLGHDPAPWIEHHGHTIRIWPDGGMELTTAAPPTGISPIEVPATSLPGLIADAHHQFQGFLDLLEPWALPLAGDTAASLGAALATHFHVS